MKYTDNLNYWTAKNIFFVPAKARWRFLQNNARQPMIGKLVDEAMEAIEEETLLIDFLVDFVGECDSNSRSKHLLVMAYESLVCRLSACLVVHQR